jgi:DNA-binding transcriptional ArsR family regulator
MPEDLDPVWKALSDPTRRAILDLVRQGPRRTTEIVDAFPHLSRFGVMKHIDVFRQIYELWVSRYEGFWADRLLRLQEDVEADRGAQRDSQAPPKDQPKDK